MCRTALLLCNATVTALFVDNVDSWGDNVKESTTQHMDKRVVKVTTTRSNDNCDIMVGNLNRPYPYDDLMVLVFEYPNTLASTTTGNTAVAVDVRFDVFLTTCLW